ncbi:MAG: hypothetical protein ACI4NG_04115 [Candidatus Gallimonas sp.]
MGIRKGLGIVQIGSRLKQAAAYIDKSAEIAAFATVPAVIRHDIESAHHKSHKGREYSTRTFAGKIKIGKQECIVAVSVKKTTGNFYKVHRVLTPDGKTLDI